MEKKVFVERRSSVSQKSPQPLDAERNKSSGRKSSSRAPVEPLEFFAVDGISLDKSPVPPLSPSLKSLSSDSSPKHRPATNGGMNGELDCFAIQPPHGQLVYSQLWSAASRNDSTSLLGGETAVVFFQKSELDVNLLKQIWARCSPNPVMNKNQFYTALRYISMAQNGIVISRAELKKNFMRELPLPIFQGYEALVLVQEEAKEEEKEEEKEEGKEEVKEEVQKEVKEDMKEDIKDEEKEGVVAVDASDTDIELKLSDLALVRDEAVDSPALQIAIGSPVEVRIGCDVAESGRVSSHPSSLPEVQLQLEHRVLELQRELSRRDEEVSLLKHALGAADTTATGVGDYVHHENVKLRIARSALESGDLFQSRVNSWLVKAGFAVAVLDSEACDVMVDGSRRLNFRSGAGLVPGKTKLQAPLAEELSICIDEETSSMSKTMCPPTSGMNTDSPRKEFVDPLSSAEASALSTDRDGLTPKRECFVAAAPKAEATRDEEPHIVDVVRTCAETCVETDTGSGGETDTGSGGETDTGSGGEIDVGSGGEIDVGSGGEIDTGSGGEIDTGSGGEIDVGSGGEIDTGSGGEIDAGTGGEIDAGTGGEIDAGTGIGELQEQYYGEKLEHLLEIVDSLAPASLPSDDDRLEQDIPPAKRSQQDGGRRSSFSLGRFANMLGFGGASQGGPSSASASASASASDVGREGERATDRDHGDAQTNILQSAGELIAAAGLRFTTPVIQSASTTPQDDDDEEELVLVRYNGASLYVTANELYLLVIQELLELGESLKRG